MKLRVSIQFILILSSVCLILMKGFSQPILEIGMGSGVMKYEGDIGGRSNQIPDIFLNKTSRSSLSGAINLTYTPIHFLGVRIQGTIGRVQGADSLLAVGPTIPLIKKIRNLHFRSPVREASLLLILHPLSMTFAGQSKQLKISPFLMAGGGIFGFNPRGFYRSSNGENEWIDLKPLRTEGQGMTTHPNIAQYELSAFSLQAGAGVQYQLSQNLRIGLEIMFRKTTTDYLDDAGGKFIDNNEFDQFFGSGTTLADQAKQMSNRTAYFNGGRYMPGVQPGNFRGSPEAKDYFYTSMLFFHYRVNKDNRMSLMKGRAIQSANCVKF